MKNGDDGDVVVVTPTAKVTSSMETSTLPTASDDSWTSSSSASSTEQLVSIGNCTTTKSRSMIVIPPIALRKGNRRKFNHEQYIESARQLVDTIRYVVSLAQEGVVVSTVSSSNSLENKVIMDYGCGPGRFLIGLQASGICFRKYIGVDVGIKEINWLTETYGTTGPTEATTTDGSTMEFIRVDVQNDRYNKNGTIKFASSSSSSAATQQQPRIFTPQQTMRLTGKVDLMVLRSVFSHMRSEDILYHLKALYPFLKPGVGVMAVSLFVRPDEQEETVVSQERHDRGLHIVILSKQRFEQMAYDCGYHIMLYTTLMGQETYILGTGPQRPPQAATESI